MNQLYEQPCQACDPDESPISEEELQELLPQIPEWKPVVRDGIMRLERAYAFRNFRQALNFTHQVGELAEAHDHHPSILTEWGKVTVTWWTHKIGGLHRTDLILAAKTDRLPGSAA